MKAVRQRLTDPEERVHRCLDILRVECTSNRRDLPGSPDIVLDQLNLALFVHGCFWHRHTGCPRTTTPKTNIAAWKEKFRLNRARDVKLAERLRRMGFSVHVVWECQTRDSKALRRRLERLTRLKRTPIGRKSGTR